MTGLVFSTVNHRGAHGTLSHVVFLGRGVMQVVAFSSPSSPEWRWRLVSYAGDIVEESYERFATIAIAISAGTQRMNDLNTIDLSRPSPVFFRSGSGRSR